MPSSTGRPAPGAPRGGPLLVGITGPIGSGKSLLCRILAEKHGCPVIDADRLGHEALGPGGAARDAVVERFGDAVLGPGGEIDRARLAAIVFDDEASLAALESVSHPAILAEVERSVGALKGSGYAGIILLEAAVLPAWLDRLPVGVLVLVRASGDVRLHRLRARGMDPQEASRRIAAQERSFADEIAADRTVDNDGSRESLERAAETLWRDLAALPGAPGRS